MQNECRRRLALLGFLVALLGGGPSSLLLLMLIGRADNKLEFGLAGGASLAATLALGILSLYHLMDKERQQQPGEEGVPLVAARPPMPMPAVPALVPRP